jgi:hypothetical protein
MDAAQVIVSVLAGLALAAAAGFRAFVPLLAAGLGIHFGAVEPAAGLQWLGEPVVLVALAAATVLEVAAYYVPGVDHVLDVVAAPVAIAAGIIAAAAMLTDLPDWARWLVAIAGGGSATFVVHGLTSLVRAKSGLATAGLGNPVVATGELAGATGIALAAIVAPLVAVVLLATVLAVALLAIRRRRRRSR